jgi:hypothetical protein
MWLWCDEPVSFEDAPDGRDRGHGGDPLGKVVGNGLRACVVAGLREADTITCAASPR